MPAGAGVVGAFEIPVILRPSLGSATSRQGCPERRPAGHPSGGLQEEPAAVGANTRDRFELHKILNRKLVDIAAAVEAIPP